MLASLAAIATLVFQSAVPPVITVRVDNPPWYLLTSPQTLYVDAQHHICTRSYIAIAL
ncbi:MAG: hypothetical protein KGL39_26145 [Patescibacteria group bacterium]|nr:hypothetical protein [Patescibacteria group bacterium]